MRISKHSRIPYEKPLFVRLNAELFKTLSEVELSCDPWVKNILNYKITHLYISLQLSLVNKKTRNSFIKEIIQLIDENEDDSVKISFYSDSIVNALLTKAYANWEKSNREGIPIEHLGDEELEELHSRAIYYSSNPIRFTYKEMIKGIEIEERKIIKQGIGNKFYRVLKRMFFASE